MRGLRAALCWLPYLPLSTMSGRHRYRTKFARSRALACPFFMPTRRSDEGVWFHPSRLPLGCGWEGHCTAPGHQGVIPEPQRLQDECSLGYAPTCPRLPGHRTWDAVRFAVSSESEAHVVVAYVCEKSHLPAEHGNLEYRVHDGQWASCHADARVQKMAECFLESWLQRTRPVIPGHPESESIHD